MCARWIAIVDCLEGTLGDYCYERIAGYVVPDFEPLRLAAMRERVPADVGKWVSENNIAGTIVSGSCHSPLGGDPWIRRLESFTAALVKTGLPLLAICFGHELLASALDGRLARLPVQAITMRDVEISEDPLFKGLGPATRQPVSHEVFVAEPPSGFDVIASTPECRVKAMKLRGRPVYGVQFHPEVDRGIKGPDPTWAPISDEGFAGSEGPVVMRNFIEIARSDSAKR
jgi:GMP synthase-like glutamine amidotransferase